MWYRVKGHCRQFVCSRRSVKNETPTKTLQDRKKRSLQELEKLMLSVSSTVKKPKRPSKTSARKELYCSRILWNVSLRKKNSPRKRQRLRKSRMKSSSLRGFLSKRSQHCKKKSLIWLDIRSLVHSSSRLCKIKVATKKASVVSTTSKKDSRVSKMKINNWCKE